MNQKTYHIEFYMRPPVDKWAMMAGFGYMRKSFAEGAWQMLKSFQNHERPYRLVCDGEVIAQMGEQKIQLNFKDKD